MSVLKEKSINYLKILFSILIFLSICKITLSANIEIEIRGNNFTDNDVILSLIQNQPDELNEDYSNYLIKTLDNSQLFENVSVNISNNKYIISIKEFSNINRIYFDNNERLKDEDLIKFSNELKLTNLNPININNFISEIQRLYESFGYNNSEIKYSTNINAESNTADLFFDIQEGEITKVNKLIFNGNNLIDDETFKSSIKTKTKTFRNFLANNNFKQFILENDLRIISNIYKNKGYLDIKVDYKIEYLKSNKVNIYFNIVEGNLYEFSTVNILDKNEILNLNIIDEINKNINSSILKGDNYSLDKIKKLKENISSIIIDNDIEFFEITSLEKTTNNEIDILYEISSVEPKYANQINIYGNSRTYDYVIRRELKLIEGDAVYPSQITNIKNKLNSLNLFKSVEISEKSIDDNLVNLEITIEEKQTGSVNAGLSVGTLDGFAVVAGLSERNFYGTGRSLDALVNTSENKTEFKFETTDRLFYENDIDVSYKANFKEEDFSKTSSYNLDTFSTGIGLGYSLNPRLRHNLNLSYLIKDYSITNASTVSSSIGKSSGQNVSFLLNNNLFYNTLNSLIIPKNGQYLSYTNIIETPTSSSNGYVKNILTYKNYKKFNRNILSFQSRVGNIFSLNNTDILTDDKFSLGGRWLRGFDNYGAGPRNSRTSYVGGNNLIVAKLDYSREVLKNTDFPLLLNLFNDYGLLWDNKTTPTNNDNSLRSSAGFGIKYYSPIGPIGFSWGFPIMDKEYDINRMFLFSVGNLD